MQVYDRIFYFLPFRFKNVCLEKIISKFLIHVEFQLIRMHLQTLIPSIQKIFRSNYTTLAQFWSFSKQSRIS